MIIALKKNIEQKKAEQLATQNQYILVKSPQGLLLVTSSKVKSPPDDLLNSVDSYFTTDSDIQLANRAYLQSTREVQIGEATIGGESVSTLMIAGPCAIESKEQIELVAKFLNRLKIKILRAGCYKPRTSPYSFQGLGKKGLELLAEIRQQYGLSIITEVKDSSHVHDVIEYSDVVQVGAKAMYDQSILRACGKARKPVLIKRGFGTTLQEFVQASEFVLSGGNDQVMLCERGIRTFETKSRFTLDLCAVSYLKAHTNLPIIIDPSHAMGHRYGIPDLSRACLAMGVEGLLIETHPTPETALSDPLQQLNFEEFQQMFESMKPVAKAIGRNLV
ncbi:MAG: 3-deoxy-7-phosphoheptulonate synthase [Bacteroidota bacterium]